MRALCAMNSTQMKFRQELRHLNMKFRQESYGGTFETGFQMHCPEHNFMYLLFILNIS